MSATATLTIQTKGKGFVDVTADVQRVVRASGIQAGLCALFLQHTSASLVIQENADPSVLRDLARFMDRLAPEGSGYEHDAEGPDDMPSHIRSALTKTSEVIPFASGELLLGTWQAIYVWEHRSAPHTRRLLLTLIS